MKPNVKRKIDFFIRTLVVTVMIFNLIGPNNAKAANATTPTVETNTSELFEQPKNNYAAPILNHPQARTNPLQTPEAADSNIGKIACSDTFTDIVGVTVTGCDGTYAHTLYLHVVKPGVDDLRYTIQDPGWNKIYFSIKANFTFTNIGHPTSDNPLSGPDYYYGHHFDWWMESPTVLAKLTTAKGSSDSKPNSGTYTYEGSATFEPNSNFFYIKHHLGFLWPYDTEEVNSVDITISVNPLKSIPPEGEGADCNDCSPAAQAQSLQGDPVNTFSGGFSLPVDDLSVSTLAGELSLHRIYNSQSKSRFDIPFSQGWVHNQDIRLIFPGDPAGQPGYVLFKGPSNTIERFEEKGAGIYTPYAGVLDTLTSVFSDPNNTSVAPIGYTVKDSEQNIYNFNGAGKLLTKADSEGRTITYNYNALGQLGKVSAENGTRFLQFTYNGNKLILVKDHTNRKVSYGYDAAGNLENVTDVLDKIWHYRYDLAGNMLEVKDPDNVTKIRNEYAPYDAVNGGKINFSSSSSGGSFESYNSSVLFLPHADRPLIACLATTLADMDINMEERTGCDHKYREYITLYSSDINNMGYLIHNPNNKPIYYIITAKYITKNLSRPCEGPCPPPPCSTYLANTFEGFVGDDPGRINFSDEPRACSGFYTYSTAGIINQNLFPIAHDVVGRWRWDGRRVESVEITLSVNPLYVSSGMSPNSDITNRNASILEPSALANRLESRSRRMVQDISSYQTRIVDNRVSDAAAAALETETETPTPSATPTNSSTQTNTPTLNATSTASFTPSPSATSTVLTATPTNIISKTPTQTSGVTQTRTKTLTPVIVKTSTKTATKTITKTATKTLTRTATKVVMTATATKTPIPTKVRTAVVTIENNGNTVHIVGDGWTKFNVPYKVGSRTILEFDYKSTVQGSVQGIGLSENGPNEWSNLYQLYGTLHKGNKTFENYAASAPGWKHYKIRIGKQQSANNQYIYLFNTDQRINPIAESYFSNIRIYDEIASGRVTRQFDGNNRLVMSLTYQANGKTVITDALGNISSDNYDKNTGLLVSQTNALGSVTKYDYDRNFRRTAITDPVGNVTEMVYSNNGINLLKVKDAASNIVNFTYDELNNLKSVNFGAQQYRTTFDYTRKRLTHNTNALNGETFYTYTPNGFVETIKDARGKITSFTYNGHGQRITMTDPLQHTWRFSYNELGRLVDTTDPEGRVNHNEYDAAGKLIKTTRNYSLTRPHNDLNQYNITSSFAYNVRGQIISITDTYNRITQFKYDAAENLIKIINADQKAVLKTYNAANQLISITDPLLHTTKYTYDAAGRQNSITDALGNLTQIAYHPDGTIKSVKDALNRTTQYNYDALKHVNQVIDPTNHSTYINYEETGQISDVTDPLGNSTYFIYDALGRMKTKTDSLGGITENFYDPAGNLIQTKDARLNPTTFGYDDANHLNKITNALGEITQYEYDTLNNTIAIVAPNLKRTTYAYDAMNRPITETDPLLNVKSLRYDAMGNVTSISDPNQNKTVFGYDALYRQITICAGGTPTQNCNNTTTYNYDANGNRIRMVDPNGHTSSIGYDALNRAVSFTDALLRTSTVTYDKVGQVITSKDALNNITTFGYDALGRKNLVIDPLQHATRYQYDAAGRLISEQNAKNIITHYDYDALSRLKRVVENYQPAALPNEQINVVTKYGYDENGNRITMTDANNHTSYFKYDVLNRLTKETDPLGHIWQYQYNLIGQRSLVTDANNQNIAYEYDDAGRLKHIDYPGSNQDVTLELDPAGRIKKMTDGVGETSWQYDELNRPISITDPYNKTVGYQYDPAGNRSKLIYPAVPEFPSGKSVSYLYNAANQLTSMTDWNQKKTAYSYDLVGRVKDVLRPNGIKSAYSYDAAGELTSISHSSATKMFSSFQYLYDALGNRTRAIENVIQPITPSPTITATATTTVTKTVTSIVSKTATSAATLTRTKTPTPAKTSTVTKTVTRTISKTPTKTITKTSTPSQTRTKTKTKTPTPGPSQTRTKTATPTATAWGAVTTIDYTYDSLSRLKTANYSLLGNNASVSSYAYTYDAAGNRTSQQSKLNGLSSTISYTYDAANRLTNVGAQAYTWDNNGNLLSDGSKTYTYDYANRLSSAAQGQTVIASFAYNGLGQRLQQTNGGQTTTYTLDINTALPQVLADGSNDYLYGLERVAQVNTATQNTSYFLTDALGSMRQMTDASATVTAARSYDPFGMVRSNAQSLTTPTTPFGYTGEQTDPSTGQVFLRARYYDPGTGRFTSRDTWDGVATMSQSMNRYAYGMNNPIRYTDPSGNCVGVVGAACGAAGGFVVGAISNIFEQLQRNGGRWGCLNINDILIAGAAGAVAGAIIGLAFGFLGPGALLGGSLLNFVVVSTTASVLGGIASRSTDILLHGQWDRAGEIFNPTNILMDALAGGIGGALGYAVGPAFKAFNNKIIAPIMRQFFKKIATIETAALEINLGIASEEDIIQNLMGPIQSKAIGGVIQKQAESIANAIKDGKITLNILNDADFDSTILKRDPDMDTSFLKRIFGLHEEGTIYVRGSIGDKIYGAVMHEGTHALDYLDGYQGWRHDFERKAYIYQKGYEAFNDIPFTIKGDINVHIESIYKNHWIDFSGK